MCYDLNEYDPFEPYWQDDYDIASEPMENYNWEEWLESGNDDEIGYCSAYSF